MCPVKGYGNIRPSRDSDDVNESTQLYSSGETVMVKFSSVLF